MMWNKERDAAIACGYNHLEFVFQQPVRGCCE
jgi:hypothetical protein